MIDRGTEIQREVVYARYPIKVAGKWVTPMEYYTREKARRIMSNARFVIDEIRASLREGQPKRIREV